MHIGIVAPEYPPEIGGMQTYACEFVRVLSERGFTVSVFTRDGLAGGGEFPNVTIHRVLKERRPLDRHILENPGIDAWHVMNASYAWLAEEVSPVVISVHGNDFVDPYLPIATPSLRRLPLLWRSRSLIPRAETLLGKWLTRRSVARALPLARAILANSRYTGQVLLEQIPACAGKVIPAMVGVSPDFLAGPLVKHPNPATVLVTVCRLDEERKNVDLVLKALARLADEFPFIYRVLGDGRRRKELTKLAEDLGIGARVDFTGRVSFEQLKASLKEADLFILTASVSPESHEGFGIAYIEANACGTPTLAARLAGAAEAVEEGRSGFFVDSVSVDALETALRRYLSGGIRFDPAACREFASRFAWESVVDAALPYYRADN